MKPYQKCQMSRNRPQLIGLTYKSIVHLWAYVRGDGVGREMGSDVESPITTCVVWNRYRTTKVIVEVWERCFKIR